MTDNTIPQSQNNNEADPINANNDEQSQSTHGISGGLVIVPKFRRDSIGRVNWSDTIPRYWQSKTTGEVVEVQRYLRVAGEDEKRIIYKHPGWGDREFSASLKEFKARYRPYHNQSTVRW